MQEMKKENENADSNIRGENAKENYMISFAIPLFLGCIKYTLTWLG